MSLWVCILCNLKGVVLVIFLTLLSSFVLLVRRGLFYFHFTFILLFTLFIFLSNFVVYNFYTLGFIVICIYCYMYMYTYIYIYIYIYIFTKKTQSKFIYIYIYVYIYIYIIYIYIYIYIYIFTKKTHSKFIYIYIYVYIYIYIMYIYIYIIYVYEGYVNIMRVLNIWLNEQSKILNYERNKNTSFKCMRIYIYITIKHSFPSMAAHATTR